MGARSVTIDAADANIEDTGDAPAQGDAPVRGGALEVFAVALGLGLTSFGGPIAHLGYFERAYVQRRRWLSAQDYAGIVALCQMIPGPASSQVGFLIGLRRAGWAGALAAWIGFSLPSALLMFAFALLAPSLSGPLAQAVLHGLKLVAVAVVAQAVWSMARKLCPDLRRAGLAVVAAAVLLAAGGAALQLVALLIGAVGGVLLCRDAAMEGVAPKLPVGLRAGAAALAGLVVLLAASFIVVGAGPRSLPVLAAIAYRAGALVFGGGHVVLPLLREALIPSGWLSDAQFLSGYGAAQALPGPLFTFAAYIGAAAAPHGASPLTAALWSAVALVAIFLPGLLAAVAGSSLWRWVGHHAAARGALAGVNAAVVGVLGAALYNPIWTSAVFSGRDLAIALVGFVLLERWRAPPVAVVGLCVAGAVASGFL
jgi:chromate transporter